MKKKIEKSYDTLEEMLEAISGKKIPSDENVIFPLETATIEQFPLKLRNMLNSMYSKIGINYKSIGIKYEDGKIDYYAIVINGKIEFNNKMLNFLTKVQYFIKIKAVGGDHVFFYHEPSYKDINNQRTRHLIKKGDLI